MYINELNGLYILTINDPTYTPVVFFVNDVPYLMIQGVIIKYSSFCAILLEYAFVSEQRSPNEAFDSLGSSIRLSWARSDYNMLYLDGKCPDQLPFLQTFKSFISVHSTDKELRDSVFMMEKSLTDERSMRLYIPELV